MTLFDYINKEFKTKYKYGYLQEEMEFLIESLPHDMFDKKLFETSLGVHSVMKTEDGYITQAEDFYYALIDATGEWGKGLSSHDSRLQTILEHFQKEVRNKKLRDLGI